jgi:hypothetical protein
VVRRSDGTSLVHLLLEEMPAAFVRPVLFSSVAFRFTLVAHSTSPEIEAQEHAPLANRRCAR